MLDALVVAGVDKKVVDGLQRRAVKLQDHLAHHYRRQCSLESTCATRCIPYALSGTGAFGCSCSHEHCMSCEEDNERFDLVEDVRGVLTKLRPHVPIGVEADDWAMQLDERSEELSAFEGHVGLYQAHLLRKALSGQILSTLLEEVSLHGPV